MCDAKRGVSRIESGVGEMFVVVRYQDGGGRWQWGSAYGKVEGEEGRWGRHGKDEFQLVD